MKFLIGEDLECDLDSLVETRLLVQAGSGAGKSHFLRRLLEQTFGKIQHLVIDTEGEFATLRERFDYVLAAKEGGDTAAEPRIAPLLIRRLLELQASAILDISELKPAARVEFVRRVAETLVDVPRKFWNPLLLVIDEAQIFCPQKGDAASMNAINDLMGRARKRNFCPVLATLRLSMLHKDSAMLCQNKLIGQSMEVDAKRAADELGLAGRDRWRQLMTLERGHFYAFGPAISRVVTKVVVGDTLTKPPPRGARSMPPPVAPEKVRLLLPQLADLPAEAEAERESIQALKGQVTGLRRELTAAARIAPPPDEAVIERHVQAAVKTATRDQEAKIATERRQHERLRKNVGDVAARLLKAVDGTEPVPQISQPVSPAPRRDPEAVTAPPPAQVSQPVSQNGTDGLRKGAVRILAELARRYPLHWTRSQIAQLTAFTASGGTFTTYLGDLRRAGYIEVAGRDVSITDDGLAAVGDVPSAPTTHDEIMAMWREKMRSGEFRLLEVIVGAGPEGIDRAQLATETEYTMTGGTFTTYIGTLRRNGLITVQGPLLRATDLLFPEAER